MHIKNLCYKKEREKGIVLTTTEKKRILGVLEKEFGVAFVIFSEKGLVSGFNLENYLPSSLFWIKIKPTLFIGTDMDIISVNKKSKVLDLIYKNIEDELASLGNEMAGFTNNNYLALSQITIEELCLPVRISNRLLQAGCQNVFDFLSIIVPYKDGFRLYSRHKNFGQVSVNIVIDTLKEKSLFPKK